METVAGVITLRSDERAWLHFGGCLGVECEECLDEEMGESLWVRAWAGSASCYAALWIGCVGGWVIDVEVFAVPAVYKITLANLQFELCITRKLTWEFDLGIEIGICLASGDTLRETTALTFIGASRVASPAHRVIWQRCTIRRASSNHLESRRKLKR